jgi:hypothetical protein
MAARRRFVISSSVVPELVLATDSNSLFPMLILFYGQIRIGQDHMLIIFERLNIKYENQLILPALAQVFF